MFAPTHPYPNHRRQIFHACALPLSAATLLAACATAHAQYAATILADKPVAYYRLEEAAGATMAVNSAPSGLLYNGIIHSGGAQPVKFRRSGALSVADPGSAGFGLAGDFITVPRTIQDDFTIEFWFRTTMPGPGNGLGQFYNGFGLVNADAPETRDDFGLSFSGGRVLFGVGNVPGGHDLTIRTTAGLNDGKWHLVDAVRTRATGSLELFVDGQSIVAATGGTQALDSPQDIQIGKIASDYGRASSPANYFDGDLDEIAFYPSALPADRIARHFAVAATAAPAGSSSASNASEAAAYSGEPGSLKVALARKLTGHSEYVNTVAFSPDGRTVASGGRDRSVRLWDVDSGTQKQILGKHDNYVSCVAFSPDGHTVVSGGWDNKIKQFDVSTGDEISAGKFNKHENYVLSLAFSPNGRRLASGSNDKTARGFAVATGASDVTATLPDAVASVAFSPNGERIAGACLDGSVYVWDAATLKVLHHLTVPAATAAPQFSVLFFDNDMLAAGGKDGAVRIWTLHNEAVLATLTTSGREIFGLAYDPNRHLLAGGGADRVIRFWSLHNIKQAKGGNVASSAVAVGHRDTVRALAFNPDGSLIASGSWDFDIDLWGLSSRVPHDRLIFDPLVDFGRTFKHSAGWTVDTSNLGTFGNPPSRLHRTGDTPENVIYHVADLKSFSARIYVQGDTPAGVTELGDRVTVSASPDNVSYKPVVFTHDAPVPTNLTDAWSRTTIQAALPSGTAYLKIEFAHDPRPESPQMAQVRLVAGGG